MLGALLSAFTGRLLGRRVGWLALGFAVVSTGALAWMAAQAGAQPQHIVNIPWAPSLGVDLGFRVDGLSLFFAFIVSGVGCLIIFYAIFYLSHHYAHQARFFCYLLLFMAAMLGTVLSDHLLTLFLFWELTGLASFLLIGFLHEQKESRIGARQALLVTGATGLAMLAGILLLGETAGSYRISELAGRLDATALADPRLVAALGLMLLGGFGKSAQFPFFFWLPNAMAAPTPVSAYLHSATMVKLGVFLCARLFSLFSGAELWAPVLLSVGFFTMLLGIALALLQTDLKAMLAFSTVSQLGFLCGYYGLGAVTGVRFDFLHVLNHTLYKGALFMIAGIVDHAAHQRDLRQLGGLFARMPAVGVAAAVCLASMAGLPGTTGFLSKESALADLLAAVHTAAPGAALALGAFAVAAVLNVIFAARFFARVFLGAPRSEGASRAHAPSLALALPPYLLAGGVLALGLAPSLLNRLMAHWAVPGLQAVDAGAVALWHGFTPELAISLGALAVGLVVWTFAERRGVFAAPVPRALRFGEHFEGALQALTRSARACTRALQTQNPMAYLPVVIGVALLLLWGGAASTDLLPRVLPAALSGASAMHVDPLRIFVAVLISLAVFGALLAREWTTQLIALSVSGFLITFYFVIYRAPDLALTQILVETVSLILILLLLGRFPKSAERGEALRRPRGVRQLLNGALAVGLGATMTALTLVMTAQPHPDLLGPFYLEATLPLAQGANAVNTILVDFRGFDTLGEITVLLVATLGCVGLLLRYKRTPEERRQGAAGAAGLGEAEGKEAP
jgi:NADH:ubiquinone oxidoreductase subunit 5 (subunit L)/multisubunit Na+/H+ antiporter MnhA subunit/multisubunit Na+/H+ antiporter MnhB subunit